MPEEIQPEEKPSTEAEIKRLEKLMSALERPIFTMIPASQNNVSLTRTFILILLLGVIGLGGFLLLKPLFTPKPVPQLFSRIEGIKRIRELHLVKLHYESIIPITEIKKTDKKTGEIEKEELKFLLVAPMQLTMYVDLGRMKMKVLPDSLVEVTLPDPQLSDIYINFREVKEYSLSDRDWSLGDVKLNFSYAKVYGDIVRKIDQSKEQVRIRANSERILNDTREKAEGYLRNLFNGLGYRVEFVQASEGEEMKARENLRERMGQILEDQNLDPKELRERIKKIMAP